MESANTSRVLNGIGEYEKSFQILGASNMQSIKFFTGFWLQSFKNLMSLCDKLSSISDFDCRASELGSPRVKRYRSDLIGFDLTEPIKKYK